MKYSHVIPDTYLNEKNILVINLQILTPYNIIYFESIPKWLPFVYDQNTKKKIIFKFLLQT